METKFIQQEILLLTSTKFSQREWCERDNTGKDILSLNEQLENACWNGLLDEMLPEIVEKTIDGKKLFLWHIRHCKSFLQIELSESSPLIEQRSSIDPYFFLSSVILN